MSNKKAIPKIKRGRPPLSTDSARSVRLVAMLRPSQSEAIDGVCGRLGWTRSQLALDAIASKYPSIFET
jgi:hypothetical protein